MTQAEKLEALVEKAKKLGWDMEEAIGYSTLNYAWWTGKNRFLTIVLEQDFARALFGEAYVDCDCAHECECQCVVCRNGWDLISLAELKSWQYHLQQAVISKDPIEYFYQAVFGGSA